MGDDAKGLKVAQATRLGKLNCLDDIWSLGGRSGDGDGDLNST